MQAFVVDSLRQNTENNGRTNFSLVSDILASQILMIASMSFTFTEVNKYENVPAPSSAKLLNTYKKNIAKLDNHFIPMVNSDCARSKFKKMCLKEGKSVAQYHVRLRPQVATCEFTDPDDVIRKKTCKLCVPGNSAEKQR